MFGRSRRIPARRIPLRSGPVESQPAAQMANTGANAGTQSIPPQMDAQAKAALESSKAAAMQQLAAAKNARPSPAIPAGVDRVDGPQKSFPDNMSVVPDVRGGGSISINPDGTHKFNEPMDMMYRGPAPKAKPGQIRHKKGGKVKSKPAAKYSSGGSTSKASSRGDGIAQRGKTKGRMI